MLECSALCGSSGIAASAVPAALQLHKQAAPQTGDAMAVDHAHADEESEIHTSAAELALTMLPVCL